MKVHIGPYRKNRKVKVTIDRYDTFSLDATLAHVIHPALIAFKEARLKMPGVPTAFFTDEDPVDKTGNHTEEAMEAAEKRYVEFLDECIWVFGEYINGDAGEEEFRKVKPEFEAMTADERWAYSFNEEPSGIPNISRPYRATHDYDREGIEKYHERKRLALENFGKHFQTFWW